MKFKVLLAGLLLSSAGFALSSWAAQVGWLGLGVTLLGLGNGLANPSLNGSISLLSGKDVQGSNLGVSQSLSSMARILGPPTGGAIYQHIGPWSPFAGAAVITFLGWLIAWTVRGRIPEGGRSH